MKKKQDHLAGRDAILTYGVASKNPEHLINGTGWRVPLAVLREATLRLWSDDAFGLAGNVAFRAVLAIFPFLIFTSSLTAFIGDRMMAEALIDFLVAIVPPALVGPIVQEVDEVMTPHAEEYSASAFCSPSGSLSAALTGFVSDLIGPTGSEKHAPPQCSTLCRSQW